MKRVATTIILLILISACDSSQQTTTVRTPRDVPDSLSGNIGGRVVIGVQQEPEMLCEILQAVLTNNMVCNLIFSKFVKYDDNFELIPDLITTIPSLENGGISGDFLTYTYHLRDDVEWHDGQPLTSADVRFTFDIIMDPNVNVESREGWDVIDSVATPDDHTVIFTLRRPYPDFVTETFYDESVLPRHILHDKTGAAFHSARFHHAPIGTGPFRFKEWVPSSHLIVEANDNYYGDGPRLDSIIFKFIPNETALLLQLQTGEIDIFDNANISFMKELVKVPGITIYQTPMLMYEHLDLNTEHPILSDKRVRQAIAYATNRVELAERVYDGLVEPATLDEFEASAYFSKTAAKKMRFSQLEARRLLNRAGWVDSDGDGILDKNGIPLALTISASAGQVNRERTELVLRDQFRQVGIDISIRNYNSTVLYGTYEDGGILKTGKYDIAMYAWLSSPAPATKEALYSSKNIPPKGQNHPRINNRRLTRLLSLAAGETHPQKRVDLYMEIQDILVEEVPVVPLFWYTSIDPVTSRLQNYRPNPTQSADTWNAAQWYIAPPGQTADAGN